SGCRKTSYHSHRRMDITLVIIGSCNGDGIGECCYRCGCRTECSGASRHGSRLDDMSRKTPCPGDHVADIAIYCTRAKARSVHSYRDRSPKHLWGNEQRKKKEKSFTKSHGFSLK